MSRPDWLVVGAPVVEFTPGRGMTGARVVHTTVDRILKRDVVLANGSRYNADRLRKSNGTWDPSTGVMHPDDPIVKRAEAENSVIATVAKARHAIDAAVLDLARWQRCGVVGREAAIGNLRKAIQAIEAGA